MKILDFGLAKLLHTPQEAAAAPTAFETEAGVVMGTVGYMSPEQVRGQPVDHRSDIFSLGVVLYEMVTGRRAFARDTAVDTMSAILKEDPPEPSNLATSVPAALERIVLHCLEKSPTGRFQSARDLAFDLAPLSGISEPQGMGAATLWPTWRRPVVVGAGVVALAGLLATAAVLGRRTATHTVPTFSQLTFRQGYTGMARFTADGESIVYSAAWEGEPRRLYLKRPDSPEALPLDLPGAFCFAVSRRGEVALIEPPDSFYFAAPGMLARAPLSGGAPREIVGRADFPEWTPDGSELAVVRSEGGRRRLESPLGKVLFETTGNISTPRFSPDGKLIAFASHPSPTDDRGWVAVVDRFGEIRRLTSEWRSVRGIAWSPGGDEIWFAASAHGLARALYAVTTAGRLRVLLRTAGDLVLDDVSPTGRAVVARDDFRISMLAHVAAEARERDLTWFGQGVPVDLSADGKVLLFFEQASIVGADYAVCLRRTDGSPPVMLGKGEAYALSPDGAWALASLPSPEAPLELLPTGPGEARQIKLSGLSHRGAVFFPDGRSVLVEGYEAGRGSRLFRVGLDGGPPQAVTPEGIFPVGHARFTISPDGSWVATTGEGSGTVGPGVWLYPIAGGERRRLPGVMPPAIPVRWSADSTAVLVIEAGEPAKIVRVEVATGTRVIVKELALADPMMRVAPFAAMSRDERTCVYACFHRRSELYLVEGLR